MLPNRLIVRAYLTRGLCIWLLMRIAVAGVIFLSSGDPALIPMPVTVQMIALSVALGFIDIQRRRERALLGNLAVSPLAIAAMFVAPALAGEIALRLLVMSVL